jgi:integrase
MASVFKRGGKSNRGGSYYVSWTDHTGRRQTKSAKTTDKATAERIGAKMEADAALRRDGVIDSALDEIGKESQRSIESHLVDHESKMRTASRTEKHIASTANFIRWIADHAGFKTAADISADGVNRYAGKLRDEGRAARTIQAHLNAIKAFTKWLTEHHKLPRDPLASVKKPNPKADRRRERRILLPEEWLRLETATGTGPERYGMTGDERLLLYRTAIQTGLRSNELRSLTRGRLYFDSDPPYVTCKAGSTKNRKDARQYIQPELAASLKAHIATKAPKAPVFGLPHETNLARMLRDDLAEARNDWLIEAKGDPQKYAQRQQSDFLADVNHEGEITDFHSLRHTCGAWLAMTGAHPKVVQTVMRHQSITLTMDTYGHLFPGQEADAVGRMREMLIAPPKALRATGTDNAAANTLNSAQRQAQRAGRESRQSGASGCDDATNPTAQKKTPKPLQIADLSDAVRSHAKDRESSGGGTRTPDTRIMIPLL